MAKKPDMSPSLWSVPEDPAERAQLLGNAIKAARAACGLTQEELGNQVGQHQQQIGKYERCEDLPGSPGVIVGMAKVLQSSPRAWLIYAEIQRLSRATPGKFDQLALEQLRASLLEIRDQEKVQETHTARTGKFSLTQFPRAFCPIAVVVGDRREGEDPQNLGDLFAFSASTVDDRWLSALGLPADTEKIADKVFMFTGSEAEQWRRETFGRKHLLVLGSPAANIFAREINRKCIFRFAVPLDAERLWSSIKDTFPKLDSPFKLQQFNADQRGVIRPVMRKFQQPGFVTFDAANSDRPIITVASVIAKKQQDFAVISLGRNPYSDPNEPFFSILVAGVHHPATAWAVKFLSQPQNFDGHPFGGILEVHAPSMKYDPDRVKWYQTVGLGSADWHKVGESDLSYNPTTLRETLVKCVESRAITDAPVDMEELQDHIALIDLLVGVGMMRPEHER